MLMVALILGHDLLMASETSAHLHHHPGQINVSRQAPHDHEHALVDRDSHDDASDTKAPSERERLLTNDQHGDEECAVTREALLTFRVLAPEPHAPATTFIPAGLADVTIVAARPGQTDTLAGAPVMRRAFLQIWRV